jgi:hypothetical protein
MLVPKKPSHKFKFETNNMNYNGAYSKLSAFFDRHSRYHKIYWIILVCYGLLYFLGGFILSVTIIGEFFVTIFLSPLGYSSQPSPYGLEKLYFGIASLMDY